MEMSDELYDDLVDAVRPAVEHYGISEPDYQGMMELVHAAVMREVERLTDVWRELAKDAMSSQQVAYQEEACRQVAVYQADIFRRIREPSRQ